MAEENKSGSQSQDNVTKEMEELKSKIADLERQLADKNAAAPTVTVVTPTTDVTIVYRSNSEGTVQIPNLILKFQQFGQEATVNAMQFDEIYGKYYRWFDSGLLSLSPRSKNIAAAKHIKTSDQYGLDASKLEAIGSKDVAYLNKLWTDNPDQSSRITIVSFVKQKIIEGDGAYRNLEKVDLLNRLTGGAFKQEQKEIGGDYHIEQTNM